MKLGRKMGNTRSIRGEPFFFRDHLISETKINKNGLKVLQLLMDFKSVPQREKLITTILGKISQMRDEIKMKTFFFRDHLISRTKINKNGLKVP